MIVAGFDLSFTMSAGVWLDHRYKVVQHWNRAITPGPKRLARAMKIYAAELLVCKPALVVVEDNAYGAPSRTVVVKLSQLNTLLKAVCEAKDIDWLEVSPSAIKKAITGKGTAEKAQVAQELKRLYGIKFSNDKGFDLSDAAAAAVWGLKHRGAI